MLVPAPVEELASPGVSCEPSVVHLAVAAGVYDSAFDFEAARVELSFDDSVMRKIIFDYFELNEDVSYLPNEIAHII